jgi:hypothetical protein
MYRAAAAAVNTRDTPAEANNGARVDHVSEFERMSAAEALGTSIVGGDGASSATGDGSSEAGGDRASIAGVAACADGTQENHDRLRAAGAG